MIPSRLSAPIRAIRAVLDAAGTDAKSLSRAEIMEAYAAQAIACIRGADLDPKITNSGGGALARGHPIGASGAILAVRLFHELHVSGGTGLAAIAAAGGLGSSRQNREVKPEHKSAFSRNRMPAAVFIHGD